MSAPEMAYRISQALRREGRRLTARTAPQSDGPSPPTLLPASPRSLAFFDVRLAWPCPEAVDWSRDYRSGTSAPLRFYGDLDYRDPRQVGDSKYTWELNRHQFIVPWALAYRDRHDEDDAAALVGLVLDWIHANPRYRGINWVSPLEMALRILSWGIAFDLCADSPGARAARPRVAASVAEQAAFIRRSLSRHSSANNHLVGELLGLLAAAVLFPDAPACARWLPFASRELAAEVLRQTFPDGASREQAIYYHHYTLEYALTTVALLGRAGRDVPDELSRRTRRMLEFVDAMTDDAGEAFEVGDRDDGTVTGLNRGTTVGVYESLLWSGWLLFRDPAFLGHATRIALRAGRDAVPDRRSAYWHGAVEPPRPVVSGPPAPRRLFADGGYFLSTDEGFSLMFKAGPFGYPAIAAHAHCDQLSLGLKRGEATVLTDAGTFVYHTDERWRRFFKGTSAHNTVGVDGLDQAEFAGPFLWATHANGRLQGLEDAPDRFAVRGTHDGYHRLPDPVTHERTVSYRKGLGYRVADRLLGRTEHRYQLFWNLGHGLALRPLGPLHSWLVLRDGEPILGLVVRGDGDLGAESFVGDERLPAGFDSRRYRERRPVPHLRLTVKQPSAHLETLLVTRADALGGADGLARAAAEWA